MKKSFSTALLILGAFLVGAALTVTAIRLVENGHLRHSDPKAAVAFIVCALVAPIFVVAWHEAGHYLGGRLVGFRAEFFVVGPFGWQREVGWHLNTDPKTFGGVCMMIPTDRRNVVRKFSNVIIAGPIASLLGAVLFASLLSIFQDPGVIRTFCGLVAVTSAAIGFATLLPIRNGAFLNDGKRFLQLRAAGPEAERDAASLELIACWHLGVPPSEWPSELFARLDLRDDSVFEGSMNYLAYLSALDAGRVDEAEQRLLRAKETMTGTGKTFEAGVLAEWDWFFGMYRSSEIPNVHDAPLAAIPGLKIRLETLRLWRSGQVSEAIARIDSGLEHLAKSRSYVFDVRRLREMHERLSAEKPRAGVLI